MDEEEYYECMFPDHPEFKFEITPLIKKLYVVASIGFAFWVAIFILINQGVISW